MAAREIQFIVGTLGCLAAIALDTIGLFTCHWTQYNNNVTVGLWDCCDDKKPLNERGNEGICDRLSWDSIPTYLLIVRVSAILTTMLFFISIMGVVTGWLWRGSKNIQVGFLLTRLQEIGTLLGSLVTLLLIAIYITNHQEMKTASEDVSIGHSFFFCVFSIGIGLFSAINLCCARGYRDYQRERKSNLNQSLFADL